MKQPSLRLLALTAAAWTLATSSCTKSQLLKPAKAPIHSISWEIPSLWLTSDQTRVATFRYEPADVPIQAGNLRVVTNGNMHHVIPQSCRIIEPGRGEVTFQGRGKPQYETQWRIMYYTGDPISEPLTVRGDRNPPIVRLTTESAVTSKEQWVGGTISIETGPDTPPLLEEMAVEVKGRGNSTWGWEKKPYALKLSSEQPLLGMPAHKRWCLLANYMDRTMLRNRMAFHIGQSSNLAWTPRSEFVEVYMNGEYLGAYLLAEQIKEDRNRVDIAEMSPNDNSGEALTGGYLLEFDTNYDEPNRFRSASTDIPVNIKYPDSEDLTDAQFAYIRNYVDRIDAAVLAWDGHSEENSPWQWLDRKSMVDYWIITELTANHDPRHPKSLYFHKDRGGKLCAGPIWDFDWETFVEHTVRHWMLYDMSSYGPEFLWRPNWWMTLLHKDASFREAIKKRWREWWPTLSDDARIFLNREELRIRELEARNRERWPRINGTGNPNRDENLEFFEAVLRMEGAYVSRLVWLDREIEKW